MVVVVVVVIVAVVMVVAVESFSSCCLTNTAKMSLDGSVNQRLDQLDKRETELLKTIDDQTNLIKKLKDDRAYYRTKCDEKE